MRVLLTSERFDSRRFAPRTYDTQRCPRTYSNVPLAGCDCADCTYAHFLVEWSTIFDDRATSEYHLEYQHPDGHSEIINCWLAILSGKSE